VKGVLDGTGKQPKAYFLKSTPRKNTKILVERAALLLIHLQSCSKGSIIDVTAQKMDLTD